jgi:hypothetical protein
MHNHIRPKTRRVASETAYIAGGIGNSDPAAIGSAEFLQEFPQASLTVRRIRAGGLHCIANGHKPALRHALSLSHGFPMDVRSGNDLAWAGLDAAGRHCAGGVRYE